MDNTEMFHNESKVVAETVGSDSKQTSSNQYRSSRALAVMDNIETFHQKKIVAAESVGVRFEADLFNLVQMIVDVCCHGQH